MSETNVTEKVEPNTQLVEIKESTVNQLVTVMPEHKQMLEVIQKGAPEIHRATSLFFKTQSQFMDNMMTVSGHTPLRNLRQILAEMNKTRDALREASLKLQKKEVEYQIKKREWQSETDDLKKQLIELDMMEILSNAESTKGYISGAIRKMTNYTEQYEMVKQKFGITEWNEEDFEKEEEAYHIAKAFEQAYTAARARNGVIDEGNFIYLTQIGINAAGAQRELIEYIKLEEQLLAEGKEPTHKMFTMFLDNMIKKYQGSAEKAADAKGMKTFTNTALLVEGDKRLLLTKAEGESNEAEGESNE